MPEERQLLLVRHGQSTANAAGVWQGQSEFPLSDEGRRQARLAGWALAAEPFDGLYSSPLGRAYETAQIVAREAGFGGGVEVVPGLTERHGGALEGLTWAEQEERDPGLAEKFLSLPEEERWSLVGAETDEDVLGRFEAAVSTILACQGAGSRAVVVTHGGVMRAFLRARFGAGVLQGGQRAENASITRLSVEPDGDGMGLLELAATQHLSGRSGPGTTTAPE